MGLLVCGTGCDLQETIAFRERQYLPRGCFGVSLLRILPRLRWGLEGNQGFVLAVRSELFQKALSGFRFFLAKVFLRALEVLILRMQGLLDMVKVRGFLIVQFEI